MKVLLQPSVSVSGRVLEQPPKVSILVTHPPDPAKESVSEDSRASEVLLQELLELPASYLERVVWVLQPASCQA